MVEIELKSHIGAIDPGNDVGCLLRAWRSPKCQRSIEKLFDSPEQARHAAATCAAWLGFDTRAIHEPVPAWWVDERAVNGAAGMQNAA